MKPKTILKYLGLSFFCIFSGCSILSTNLSPEEKSKVIEFQSLLKDGWNITTVSGKVVLIKNDSNGLQIKDIFNVLND